MLKLIPVSLADANAFVETHHHHHKAVTGHKFSIGCEKGGQAGNTGQEGGVRQDKNIQRR